MSLAANTPLSTSGADTKATTRGQFLVFEGIDGSGKSSIARIIHERMIASGKPSILTAEPTDNWIGDMIYRANREAISPFTETLLYIADRSEHTEQIERWLNNGKYVICDRYMGSTLAYQSVTLRPYLGDLAQDWLRSVNAPFALKPNITFLLSLPPEMAMKRLGSRPDIEKFEKLDFLRSVDKEYQKLADIDNYVVIDASLSKEQVANEVWSIITRI
ncbi:MAG: dTMP kinase [Euryarchaeota archaeon]|nr:dTMP kinase [Euryarchaeota archaeon]